MSTILIIDDEPGIRDVLSDVLSDEGHEVAAAEDGHAGLAHLAAHAVDLVFLDVWLPNLGGIDVLRRIRAEFPDVAVVMISGHANIKLAVEAVKMGAFDFLEKPLALERTTTAARNALALAALRRENRTLKNSLFVEDTMVGSSEGMRRVQELIEQAAASDSRILVLGENGTGKELVAREVHRRSRRADGPFVEVNCAALPEPLIESELFGHEKGAFTSAHARRRGKLELAHRGTLFLDEIADMSLVTQAKVLRVLQEMRFERVGGEEPIEVDVRVIAATNRDIESLVRERKFREDLYFRINVVPIRVPALRERLDDLPALVGYFLGKFRRPSEECPRTLSAEALARLSAYGWPGQREGVEKLRRADYHHERGSGDLRGLGGPFPRVVGSARSRRGRGRGSLRGPHPGGCPRPVRAGPDRREARRVRGQRGADRGGARHARGDAPQQDEEVAHSSTQAMKGLTTRQREVFDFIRSFISSKRYPPTIREIAVNFGFSVKGSYDHVKALQKKGFIRCAGNRSRAIEVVADSEAERQPNLVSVPVLGAVAAGRPLFAEENLTGWIQVPAASLKKGQHFALQVRGDSMKDAGIMDGDVVVVSHQETAENGEIVVAMVDEAVTLKRFFVERNRVRLKAENPKYPPLYTQNVRILGRLAFLMRSYA